MILQSTGIKITHDVKPSAQECCPHQIIHEQERQSGPSPELRRDKNRALMACSDMEESGKWTDIFIKKNG
jgi:hypothetical protein